jgi:enoyl-CoA hydratase/carnithine racemase
MNQTGTEPSATSSAGLLVALEAGVLRITINRPERRNALTNDLCEQLHLTFEKYRSDDTVRCVVITGAGDAAFCAGGDLKPGDSPFAIDFNQIGTRLAEALRAARHFPVPLIARINGACMAGGVGLLSMCDIAVAADDVKLGLPEVKIGLFPMQVVVLLRERIAPRHLADLAYTGRAIDARTALEMGLLNRAVPRSELDDVVQEYVDAILAAAPNAIRRGRYALAQMNGMTFDQALSLAETTIAPMSMADDAREGILAFNEKRRPSWPTPATGLRKP